MRGRKQVLRHIVSSYIVTLTFALVRMALDSVSGQWKSASEMAQDFAGLSSRSYAASARPKNAHVNLYLPE